MTATIAGYELQAGDALVDESGGRVRLYCRWEAGGWVAFRDNDEGVLIHDEDIDADGPCGRCWWLDEVAS